MCLEPELWLRQLKPRLYKNRFSSLQKIMNRSGTWSYDVFYSGHRGLEFANAVSSLIPMQMKAAGPGLKLQLRNELHHWPQPIQTRSPAEATCSGNNISGDTRASKFSIRISESKPIIFAA